MPTPFSPIYSNPADGQNITLCKILEALSLGSQNLTAGGNAFDVNVVPAIGNGLPSVKSFTTSTLSGNNIVQAKASPALLGTVLINNTNASDSFVSFFDNAAATNTSTPLFSLRARANASISFPLVPSGVNFVSGLAFAVTTSFGGSTLASSTGIDVAVTYL
jgi:DNA primase